MKKKIHRHRIGEVRGTDGWNKIRVPGCLLSFFLLSRKLSETSFIRACTGWKGIHQFSCSFLRMKKKRSSTKNNKHDEKRSQVTNLRVLGIWQCDGKLVHNEDGKEIKVLNNEDQLCASLSSFPSFFCSR